MGKTRVGVGFATGRKNFQHVLKNYILNWKESGLIENDDIEINVYVAYDLTYKGTRKSDYTSIPEEIKSMIQETHFFGEEEIAAAKEELVGRGITDISGASLLFGNGYAAQRNLILFNAIRDNMDCLLFIDDDDYPFAVTRNRYVAIWSGQQVLKKHIENIQGSDITCGYHCGYISPIPTASFIDDAETQIFKTLIEALSNDIVNWNSLREVMNNGGVTYADTKILVENEPVDVPEINRAKFISGSNLCINLTDPRRVFPFYNPPGARGEDTFLSTCLSERRVLRIPCYTFHDGFSVYENLLSGVLPTQLSRVDPTKEQNIQRFLSACIGWARYKPLLLYITQPESYREKINEAQSELSAALPYVCNYFKMREFLDVQKEMLAYDAYVSIHCDAFHKTKELWAELMDNICSAG